MGALIDLFLFCWVLKWLIDHIPDQNYTKADMEKFWGYRFDGTKKIDKTLTTRGLPNG